MGLFDFVRSQVDPDERRWRKEAQEEAREYRQEAKEFMQEAKSLYEDDYKELKTDARRMANNVGDLIKQHITYKADLLKELGGEINSSIENFKRFNVDSHVIKSIDIGSGSFSVPSISTSALSNFAPNIGGSFSLPSLVLSAFSDPYKDKDKAYEQRSKAQEYLWQVEDAVNQMKQTIEILKSTKQYVLDERDALDELMGKIRKIVNQLGSATQKTSYTEHEARYVKGICKVAEIIKKTLEEQIANNDGKISTNYKKYSERIRQINRAIPSAPVLKESSNDNWLSVIINY